MQMGARELLMHYMDLKQTNDVQLTFEALKVKKRFTPVDPLCCQHLGQSTSDLFQFSFPLLAVPGFSAAAQEVCCRVCGSWRGSEVVGNPQTVYGCYWSVSVPLLPSL